MEKIKKIDIHVHSRKIRSIIRQTNHKTYALPHELRKIYDDWGIEKGVLLTRISPEMHFHVQTNEQAMELAADYPDLFWWFMDLHPKMGMNSVETDFSYFINFYKQYGVKGVGELTANMEIDHPMTMNLFKHCEKCQMPTTIHISEQIGGMYGLVDELELPGLHKVLETFPNLKILGHSACFWSHIGKNVNESNWNGYVSGEVNPGILVEMFSQYPNLLGDLSAGSGNNAIMRDEEFGLWFLEQFQDRLYFGTDLSSADLYFEFPFWLDRKLEEGKIKESVYKKICRENALKLLGEM
ncbi:MAG: amidohydrolase family protein [Clostridia bacterium]|nr:amidohydrolase family protein [Clostridia bacterium]